MIFLHQQHHHRHYRQTQDKPKVNRTTNEFCVQERRHQIEWENNNMPRISSSSVLYRKSRRSRRAKKIYIK